MLDRFRRFRRMGAMLLGGEISFHSFRIAMRPDTIAVCRTHGGMVFCEPATEAVYFGRNHA